MNKILEHFFASVVVPYLQPRMRSGAIKATKAYLEAVKYARLLVMQGFVIGSLSAILITGLLLLVFGVLALLPLQPQVLPIVAIVVGTIFAGVTGAGFYVFFREGNWLRVTKSYEMMEAALGHWESEVQPPNPLAVLRGEGPKGGVFTDDAESSKSGVDSEARLSERTPYPAY